MKSRTLTYHPSPELGIRDFSATIPTLRIRSWVLGAAKNPVSLQSKHGLAYNLDELDVPAKYLWGRKRGDKGAGGGMGGGVLQILPVGTR